MLFETLAIALVIAASVYFMGFPAFKIFSIWHKNKQPRNPVEEARKRLADIQAEVEAAKLNKQTEKLIDTLYEESLEDSNEEAHYDQQKR